MDNHIQTLLQYRIDGLERRARKFVGCRSRASKKTPCVCDGQRDISIRGLESVHTASSGHLARLTHAQYNRTQSKLTFIQLSSIMPLPGARNCNEDLPATSFGLEGRSQLGSGNPCNA